MTGFPSIDKPWLKFYSKDEPCVPSPNQSIYAFLKENTQVYKDWIALDYYGSKVTYGELLQNVDKVASALKTLNICEGDIVSVCPLNTPEFFYLIYAINKIGAISNIIGLTSPETDLHDEILQSECKVVFTISMALDVITKAAVETKVEKIISIPIESSMPLLIRSLAKLKSNSSSSTDSWKKFLKLAREEAAPVDADGSALAIIVYTGGSTGVPKGVMLSNKALNSHYVDFNYTNHCGIFAFEKGDRMISGVPLFLAFGILACCHSPLCHAMELVLAPDPSPKAGTRIIMKSKINHVMAGRLLIEELVAEAKRIKADLSFIKSIMYGGEETNKVWEKRMLEELKVFHIDALLLNSYGMSETSAGVLTAPSNEIDGLIPCANVNVRIVDPDDSEKELSYDTEGELCISTEQLMLGYYKNDKENADVFFEKNGTIWLKTHDLATISADGIIKITGRIKRIYSRLTSDKIQVRVYPMRIEEVLTQNELVRESAVVGIKDDMIAYRSVAYIILEDKSIGVNTAKVVLDAWCRENLPDSHVPDKYVFVDEFPITRAGKVDYMELVKWDGK